MMENKFYDDFTNQERELETVTDFFVQGIRHAVACAGQRERDTDAVLQRLCTRVLEDDSKWNQRAAALVQKAYHDNNSSHIIEVTILQRRYSDRSLVSEGCLAIQLRGQNSLDAVRLVTFTRCDEILFSWLDMLIDSVYAVLEDCFDSAYHSSSGKPRGKGPKARNGSCDIAPIQSARKMLKGHNNNKSHGDRSTSPGPGETWERRKHHQQRPRDLQRISRGRRNWHGLAAQNQQLPVPANNGDKKKTPNEEIMVPRKRPNFTRRFRSKVDSESPSSDNHNDPSTHTRKNIAEHHHPDKEYGDEENQILTTPAAEDCLVEKQHDNEKIPDMSHSIQEDPKDALVGKRNPLRRMISCQSTGIVWKVLLTMGAVYYVYSWMRLPA